MPQIPGVPVDVNAQMIASAGPNVTLANAAKSDKPAPAPKKKGKQAAPTAAQVMYPSAADGAPIS